MNCLTIPASANWYRSDILACAPDNTVIYGTRNDIVILENRENIEEVAKVRLISRAHCQKIKSIHLNRNWGKPQKLALSTSDDKAIKIWDVQTGKRLYSHGKHVLHNGVAGANFAGDNKVISVSEDGVIIIWNFAIKETQIIQDLFVSKVTVTHMSTCPHASWLTAFGLKNGVVVVADLRKSGKVLYRLRGHDKTVISLSWCPVPINIFPKNNNNFVGPKICNGESGAQVIDQNGRSEEDPEPAPMETSGSSVEDQTDNTSNENSSQVESDKNSSEQEEKTEESSGEEKTEEIIGEEKNEESNSREKTEESNGEEKTEESNCGEKTEESNSKEKTGESNNETLKSDEDVVMETNEHNSSAEKIENEVEEMTVNTNEAEKTNGIEDNDTSTNDTQSIPEPQEEEPRKEYLLASSGQEGNIYIWRAGSDGRMQTLLNIPRKIGKRKFKVGTDKLWVTVCWATPTKLFCSSKTSDLLMWTLPKPLNESGLSLIHSEHSSLLFSIATPLILYNKSNWNRPHIPSIWTVSQDRILINKKISEIITDVAYYPTLGGNIQIILPSLVDPNKLAIGTCDGFVKIWDLSMPYNRIIQMNMFGQKIQAKVSAMAWHPFKENVLAFGTTEGRVGYLDPNSHSKPPELFQPYFNSTVYKFQWAPIDGNKNNFGLYAVGEGSLVLFDFSKKHEEPVKIKTLDDIFIYSVAWKPDYSFVILVTKQGYFLVYTPEFKLYNKHYLKDRVFDLQWHPDAATSGSRQNRWLATISGMKKVHVIAFDENYAHNDQNIVNTYIGPSETINSIAWNPYEPSQLVIGCEIGIIEIWDAQVDEIMNTIVNNNFEPVLSAIISPVNEDYVISGGKDTTLQVWKISEHPKIDSEEICSRKKAAVAQTHEESNFYAPTQTHSQQFKAKKTKHSLFTTFYHPKNSVELVLDLKKLLFWKEENVPSADKKPVKKITEPFELDILNVFGTKESMLSLLDINDKQNRDKGKYHKSMLISLFKGDISSSIKEAIEEKRVTMEIVTLAPMVSPKLWQQACETYAEQLTELSNSDPLQIAMFYLSCHKVEKAVDALCDGFLFREALALAKCRMLDDDVTKKIVEKWIKYAVHNGNYEIAAFCYIFLGKHHEAAALLYKRNDPLLLDFAEELAYKSGNEQLQKAISYRSEVIRKTSSEEECPPIPLRHRKDIIQDSIVEDNEDNGILMRKGSDIPEEDSFKGEKGLIDTDDDNDNESDRS